MIGFARRAGKTIIGTELVCRAMPKGVIRLVAISATASEGTRARLTHKCEYYNIPSTIIDLSCEELGALLGKGTNVATVAICDTAFADEILKITAPNNNKGGLS